MEDSKNVDFTKLIKNNYFITKQYLYTFVDAKNFKKNL